MAGGCRGKVRQLKIDKLCDPGSGKKIENCWQNFIENSAEDEDDVDDFEVLRIEFCVHWSDDAFNWKGELKRTEKVALLNACPWQYDGISG